MGHLPILEALDSVHQPRATHPFANPTYLISFFTMAFGQYASKSERAVMNGCWIWGVLMPKDGYSAPDQLETGRE